MELMIIYIKPSPKPRMGNHSKISIGDPTGATAQSSGLGSCVLHDALRHDTLQAWVDPESSMLAATFACETFHPDLC